MTRLKLRPHHFLCAINFRGKGYTKEFVDNFYFIIDTLENKNPELLIDVVCHNDDVCAYCLHTERCAKKLTDSFVDHIDQRHMQILNFPKVLKWSEAKDIIRKNVSMETFHWMCAKCPWKNMGICESALKDFLISYSAAG